MVVSRTIIEEVRRHLDDSNFKKFWALLVLADTTPVEPWEIPEETLARFVTRGLKHGDAAIAALVDVTGADAILTENRDLHQHPDLPFKVYRAAEFLRL